MSDLTLPKLTQDQFKEIVNPLSRPIRTWHCGFSYLENWLKAETEIIEFGVELVPDFQRGHVWNIAQQTKYIENVLRRIIDESGLTIRFNCPSWQTDRTRESNLIDQMVCIDGLQRLTSIRKFIAGELKVFGITFDQLPMRQILRDLQIIVKMYDFQFKAELLQFYLDINEGGIAHSDDELERVRNLLKEAKANSEVQQHE